MSKGHQEWMRKLRAGELDGPQPKLSQFLPLLDDNGKPIPVKSNPRSTTEYQDRCVKEAQLGPHFSQER